MKVIEILNEYRNGKLEIKMKYGQVDEKTTAKINVVEQIFADSDLLDFVLDHVRVVRLYYKERKTAEEIAKIIHVSERHVYRMRDSCVKWLSDLLDREE